MFNRCTGPVYDTIVVGFDCDIGCVNLAPNRAPERPTPDIRRAGNDPIRICLPTIPASRTPSRGASSNPRAAAAIFPANCATDEDVPTAQAVARVQVPAPGHCTLTVASSPTLLPNGLYFEISTLCV